MTGDFAHAKHAAAEVAAHAAPMLQDMPMAETHAPYPIFMLLRFHYWDDVLALPAPSPGTAMTNAFWRFEVVLHLPRRAKLPLQKRNARFLRRRAKKHLQMWSAGDQTGGMPESAGRI